MQGKAIFSSRVTHRITEQRDALGRSTGCTYAKNDIPQQQTSISYGADGRVDTVGFTHQGEHKEFTYSYLPGTHLLHTLTHPNGLTLTQSYEPQRDLLTQMDYRRADALIVRRGYTYDILGRPTARDLARYGTETQDTFGYNTRSESPRGLGGGLDNARSGIAPKGRAGNGVPASQPTQPTATRPLAIQKNGTWYTYGWDLTKNICETYRTDARIDLAYTYTPYGEVSPAHAYDQPLRWSSEYHDTELGLVYYNYRHYNPAMGRWIGRDLIDIESEFNLYAFVSIAACWQKDQLGLHQFSEETILKALGSFELGKDGKVKECWCMKFAIFLDMLANDPSIKTLNDFIDALGSGRDADDLVNKVANGLAIMLNKQMDVSTKLFSETKDPVHMRTDKNISIVGFKDQFLANGANNARHFSYTITYGRPGYFLLKLSDKSEGVLNSIIDHNSNRSQENLAEVKADNAGLSCYKEIKKAIPDSASYEQWSKNKHKIAKIWTSRFCR